MRYRPARKPDDVLVERDSNCRIDRCRSRHAKQIIGEIETGTGDGAAVRIELAGLKTGESNGAPRPFYWFASPIVALERKTEGDGVLCRDSQQHFRERHGFLF